MLAASLFALGVSLVPASAGEYQSIVVMQVDGNMESLPRASPICQGSSATIAAAFAEKGFAALVDGDLVPTLTAPRRMTDAELLVAVRGTGDMAGKAGLLYSVFMVADMGKLADGSEGMVLDARIEGRLVELGGDKTLGAYVTPPTPVALPSPCDRDCIMEAGARQVERLAGDFADAMGEKLAGF